MHSSKSDCAVQSLNVLAPLSAVNRLLVIDA
jgi:hypothetical protein